MKTSLKSIASAFLLGLMLSTSVSAIDDTTQKKKFAVAVFPAANSSTLWLCLEKYQSEQAVNLQLVSERGDVLYEEVMLGKRSKKKCLPPAVRYQPTARWYVHFPNRIGYLQ